MSLIPNSRYNNNSSLILPTEKYSFLSKKKNNVTFFCKNKILFVILQGINNKFYKK